MNPAALERHIAVIGADRLDKRSLYMPSIQPTSCCTLASMWVGCGRRRQCPAIRGSTCTTCSLEQNIYKTPRGPIPHSPQKQDLRLRAGSRRRKGPIKNQFLAGSSVLLRRSTSASSSDRKSREVEPINSRHSILMMDKVFATEGNLQEIMRARIWLIWTIRSNGRRCNSTLPLSQSPSTVPPLTRHSHDFEPPASTERLGTTVLSAIGHWLSDNDSLQPQCPWLLGA
ncbi:hypothetical protein HD806DRAFT_351907 [Xylariaceae sp. AK1471]|nr:hypothetical protein HD806DRAFT_351907 [Xylariaceae sp. AK1471]